MTDDEILRALQPPEMTVHIIDWREAESRPETGYCYYFGPDRDGPHGFVLLDATHKGPGRLPVVFPQTLMPRPGLPAVMDGDTLVCTCRGEPCMRFAVAEMLRLSGWTVVLDGEQYDGPASAD